MKAIVYEKYGTPDVLEFREIKKPVPAPHEVLIKVYATSVAAGDWRMRKADPFLVRLFNGLLKPRKVRILGFELAGVIGETGSAVTSFKPGDAVFASCGVKGGAYAEYKCFPENGLLALKPANLTFEEAATVPTGGLTALSFLRKANLSKGQSILIYGASGSVGTFAVQLAVYFGATVTAVCSTGNIALVKSLGADRVIDYTKEDFTGQETRYDVIFDAVGKTSRRACKKILKPGGKYITVTRNTKPNLQDLLLLKEIIEAGKLKPVIDRTYKMEEIREAHRYVEQFHKKGNVVVSIFDPGNPVL